MEKKVIIIEPFYGGSHKILIDSLIKNFQNLKILFTLITLPAKKWHWRARCGALQLLDKIPKITNETVLWTSSVLSLAELIGIRPDLVSLKKIVYFHENQLIYPVQEIKSRDVQYSYNQITTCLAADVICFNSYFNMQSFLDNISKILKLIPDHRPKSIKFDIVKKSRVLYFPVYFPIISHIEKSSLLLHIVWPHRWEFDKGPEDFFEVCFKLKQENIPFKLFVLGETYKNIPDIFEKSKSILSEEILQFGFVENKEEYYNILCRSNVAVSTAKHEFFGVSMLEATYCGCFPLVPNALVYSEIFPQSCLYSDKKMLFNRLKEYCLNPCLVKKLKQDCTINFDLYSETKLIPEYLKLFGFEFSEVLSDEMCKRTEFSASY